MPAIGATHLRVKFCIRIQSGSAASARRGSQSASRRPHTLGRQSLTMTDLACDWRVDRHGWSRDVCVTSSYKSLDINNAPAPNFPYVTTTKQF